jgi:VCBS repeat-containing protein
MPTLPDIKRITELPYVTGTPTGAEVFPVVKDGVTYKYTINDLAHWLTTYLNINSAPVTQDFSQSINDTGLQLTGNLLSGAYDNDGEPIVVGNVVYAGTSFPVNTTSQAVYGTFYWEDNGFWVYILGAAARALTTGDVIHEVFTVVSQDPRGGLSTKHLTLTIVGTNSAPIVSYVNGSTPMNHTLQGNLIYRLAFDYETVPVIGSYSVDGISGSHPVGTGTTISGVGTIVIQENGDYTFTPVGGFVGPVPLITYIVTDGVNDEPGYLTISINPSIAGSQPVVLYTDIVSGPVDDGSGDNTGGACMHVYGVRFGDSSGLGTTTKIYIGDIEVGEYITLEADPNAKPGFGRQRMGFRVGALSGATLGKPLHLKVVVGGQDSNTDAVFTPNPGRIFYVSKFGNDSTGVIGDPSQPFRFLQIADRHHGGVYPLMRAGDQIVVRGDGGAEWTDTAYATAWLRFADSAQQGSNPTGDPGTGWLSFIGYPGEDVKYRTTAGNKGGFQGPSQAITGTTGDFVVFSNFRMRWDGGATRDAGGFNMQYNAQRCRVVGNEIGPWIAGDSPVLNCAGITGEGNYVEALGNYIHDIEGTAAQQNHGLYPGTNSYGWTIAYNWIENITGGSHLSFNDSDGGTGTFETPFGTWMGFTNIKIHHNWMEGSAKYSVSFNDVGAQQGQLDARIYNNVIIGTGLPPFHLGTTTATADVVVAFNTIYDCNRTVTGGNAVVRNDGWMHTPGRQWSMYNNIIAFGPNTVPGTGWLNDTTGFSDGIVWSRNLYWVNGDTTSPAPPSSDALAVIGDPKFVDPTVMNLKLQSSSPAVNAGTQALPADLIMADDFTCQLTREPGGAPDIGAFEFNQPTPYIITPPTFTGGPQIGVATSAGVGSWGNSPTSYSRQFRVNGSPAGSAITGTGTASYTPVAGDERKTLVCDVSATNASGTVTYSLNIGTIAVGSGAPVNTALPVVTGSLASGTVSSLSDGSWTGATHGYAYDWMRGSTVLSGETANTYTKVPGDVGFMITGRVYALDPVNGSQVAAAVAVGPITPAPADPVIEQAAVSHSLIPSTNVNFSFGSDVGSGNLILAFMGEWDQAPYNGHYSDSQGHGTSDFTRTTAVNHTAGNPWIGWGYFKTVSSAPYSLTINMDSGAGGAAIAIEVGGLDVTTVMDIPTDSSQGTGTTSISLTATTATTKPNDLVLIGVCVAGTSHTITPDTGWTLVDTVVGTFQAVWIFKKKETATETFAFSATADSSCNWICQSFVVKGS